MRGFGLLLLIAGVFCCGAAYINAELPFLPDLSNADCWIIGGCLAALGAAVLLLARAD